MLLSQVEINSKERLFTHISNLTLLHFHLQMSGMFFDKITVQLKNVEGVETLAYLKGRTKEIKCYVEDENIDQAVVQTLCAIYPEKASKIRRAFISKTSVSEVLYV